MKEVIKFLKENVISFLIVLGILLISLVIIIVVNNGKFKLREFKNQVYKTNYDATWKVVKDDLDKVEFKHKSGSTLSIQKINLTTNLRNYGIDSLIDDLIYILKEDNSNYNLISYAESSLGNKLGYKILFEKDNIQSLISVFKSYNDIVLSNYTAKSECFDLLLLSANNIVNNLELVTDVTYDDTKLDFNFQKLTWDKNDELNNKLQNKYQDFLINESYKVEYKIPDIFVKQNFSYSSNYYEFDFYGATIYFELLSNNIYSKLQDIVDYSLETIYEKIDEKTIIVKSTSKLFESSDNYTYYYYYLHEIDKVNTVYVRIFSDDGNLHQKMIKEVFESIELNIEKINDNMYSLVDDDYIISEMKEFISTSNSDYYDTFNMYYDIKIKLPIKYTELDTGNGYSSRKYAINYHEFSRKYDCMIKYDINYYKEVEENYSIYEDFKIISEKTLNLNGKKFNCYKVKYYDQYNKVNKNETVLVFDLGYDDYLHIILDFNTNNITDGILKEVTNFEFAVQKYVY